MNHSFPDEVYLNGQWLSPEAARVSVFDRGFIYGDGIYEVIPFYQGTSFLLKEHLKRLEYCLNQIRLKFDPGIISDIVFEALRRSKLDDSDAAVYIQITRGVNPRTHFIPENTNPTILVYAFPAKLKDFENRSWKVLIAEDLRWHRCDIKSTSWLANAMANTRSHDLGLDETILFRNGVITEGSHSSIFFIKNEEIFTHPEGPEILSGITRAFVIELAKELDLVIKERPFRFQEIAQADEAFCTGTTTQVMALSEMYFKEKRIFNKPTGPVTRKIQEAFIEKTQNL